MRIARFVYKQKKLWGVVEGSLIKVLKGNPFAKIDFSDEVIVLKQAKLLAPAMPQKIVLVGLNYKDHAKELGMKIPKEPIIFLKPVTTLNAHLHKIKYPKGVKQLDY